MTGYVCALCGRESPAELYPLCEADAETIGDTVGLSPSTEQRHGRRHTMRAYGWSDDGVTVVDEEAEVLRLMAAELLAGGTLRGVAAELDARGIRTAQGKAFAPITIKRALTNPRIAGKREVRGDLVPADPDPILTVAQYRRLREKLLDPERSSRFTRHHARVHLLADGVARCYGCGHRLYASSTTDGLAYRCRETTDGCGKVWVKAELLEAAAGETIVNHLANWADAISEALVEVSSETGLSRELEEIEARRTVLAAEYGSGSLSQAAYDAGIGAANRRVEEIRRRLDAAVVPSGAVLDAYGIAVRYATIGRKRQRDLVEAVVDHIDVRPSERKGTRGLDPDRVDYVFRPVERSLLLRVARILDGDPA